MSEEKVYECPVCGEKIVGELEATKHLSQDHTTRDSSRDSRTEDPFGPGSDLDKRSGAG